MTKMDRNERRAIGAIIRRDAKERHERNGDPMFSSGFCYLAAQALHLQHITCAQYKAFDSLVSSVIARAADADCHTCFLPRAVTLKASNKKTQAAIRASWLRHWEETGVALDYIGWAARAEGRKAAALARKAAKETNVAALYQRRAPA